MPGKPKGLPKTGGRKPGSLNKKTMHFDLQAKCDAKGIDVWEKALEYLIYPCDETLRFNVIKELMKYLYPQRKAVEHSMELKNPYMDKSVSELESLVKNRLEGKEVVVIEVNKPENV